MEYRADNHYTLYCTDTVEHYVNNETGHHTKSFAEKDGEPSWMSGHLRDKEPPCSHMLSSPLYSVISYLNMYWVFHKTAPVLLLLEYVSRGMFVVDHVHMYIADYMSTRVLVWCSY